MQGSSSITTALRCAAAARWGRSFAEESKQGLRDKLGIPTLIGVPRTGMIETFKLSPPDIRDDCFQDSEGTFQIRRAFGAPQEQYLRFDSLERFDFPIHFGYHLNVESRRWNQLAQRCVFARALFLFHAENSRCCQFEQWSGD